MKEKIALIFFILPIILSSAKAYAVGSGGFENASFSAKSIGESNAVVAQADEPAAISYNPAGLTQLKGLQFQSSNDFIGVATSYSGPNGDHGKSDGVFSYVPTAYTSFNPGRLLNDRLVFGIGTDAPFGLANKYNSNKNFVHYVGYQNAIRMYTIKPVMAIKINDKLSIGGGPMYYRLFDLENIFAYPNRLLGAFPDGQLRANLSGNSWGWQMGVLAKPSPKHQFGFYFRSPVHMILRGRVKVERATVGGNFQTGASTKFDLPLNMTWAYAFKPNEKATLEADFGYTRWSTLRRLYVNTDHVNASDDIILAAVGKQDKDYQDGFSIHIGGNYDVTKKWSVRAGSLFYWAVIPADHFSAVIPDSNRLGFTLGAGYKITKYLNFDFSYFAALNLTRKIDNSLVDVLGQTLDGRYFSYVHGIYLTLTYKWEDLLQKKISEDRDQAIEKAIVMAPSQK